MQLYCPKKSHRNSSFESINIYILILSGNTEND